MGQRHILPDVQGRDEVIALENERNLPGADLGQLPLGALPDRGAVQEILPRVGTSRQPRMFIIVDLPEPEVPMMATNSPWSMLSVTHPAR